MHLVIRVCAMVLLAFNVQACLHPEIPQHTLKNLTVREHRFLADMYADDHYPNQLVDRCNDLLVQLCRAIEREQPTSVSTLYPITHYYTKKFNDLQDEFDLEGSELETVAREAIAAEFAFIAEAYGFDADGEEMIAPRTW